MCKVTCFYRLQVFTAVDILCGFQEERKVEQFLKSNAVSLTRNMKVKKFSCRELMKV